MYFAETEEDLAIIALGILFEAKIAVVHFWSESCDKITNLVWGGSLAFSKSSTVSSVP